ncbi:MAG: NUDIX hydrolase [Crocinitomicaceae bacterium]|nr:NUDIX hydrolase [Crocinitomicaceae bacterium]|tara:strand:- start:118954 stop:119640 length:687 start_codon:yes stop_codon:yes gene_type:complete
MSLKMNQSLSVTVDNVLFTIRDDSLHVLLVKRAKEPFAGQWALPGGILDTDKDADGERAASRILEEKTGLRINYLEQLRTYAGDFDPRGYTVSIAHFALTSDFALSPKVASVEEAQWVPVKLLSDLKLAFIHRDIIEDALNRLREKAKYSLIPLYCLPKQFTIVGFTKVMSVILGKTIQRKTVQRRLEQVEAIVPVKGEVATGTRGPQSQLYTLTKPINEINFERNLN